MIWINLIFLKISKESINPSQLIWIGLFKFSLLAIVVRLINREMKNYVVSSRRADVNHDLVLIQVAFKKGICVELLNFGATLRSVEVPDRHGNRENTILSYDDVEQYLNDKNYLGSTVGRYTNRINKGMFRLNGEKHQLSINSNGDHLHGGVEGFDICRAPARSSADIAAE